MEKELELDYCQGLLEKAQIIFEAYQVNQIALRQEIEEYLKLKRK